MAKEALTLAHLADGDIERQVNDALQKASQAIDASDNPKASAKVTLEVKLSSDSDNFRTVASSVKLTAPAPASKKEVFPVNRVNDVRIMTVDPELKDDQLQLPGVADLNQKRATQA